MTEKSLEATEIDDDNTQEVTEPEEFDKNIENVELPPHDDLDSETPLANKILTGATLMIVGGAIALWAGPKIAPTLPQGMEPVAKFLSPSSSVTVNEINGLRSEFEERFIKIENAAPPEIDTSAIDTKFTSVEEQIAQLSTSIDTVKTSIDTVKTDMSTSVSELQTALETDQTRAVSAEQQSMLLNAISQIRVALVTGAPFNAAISSITAAAPSITIPEGLTIAADAGVPTILELQESFKQSAGNAIRASETADTDPNASTGSKLTSFLKSQIATRSTEPQKGDSTDAILSRVEDKIEDKTLKTALSEASTLTDAPKAALGKWIKDATLRINAVNAFPEIETATATANTN